MDYVVVCLIGVFGGALSCSFCKTLNEKNSTSNITNKKVKRNEFAAIRKQLQRDNGKSTSCR